MPAINIDTASLTKAKNIISQIGADFPILMFPVRLETRFASNNQLKVRIFPDDIFVHQLDRALTQQEAEDGKMFLTRYWIRGFKSTMRFEEWKAFCIRYGARRAAYIVYKLKSNWGDIAPKDNYEYNGADENIMLERIKILRPQYDLEFNRVSTRKPDEHEMPTSYILPDHFILIAKPKDKAEMIVAGKPVRKNLQLGIHLSEENSQQEQFEVVNGDLKVSKGMKWMTDYDEAVNAGMAITLSYTENVNHFEYIYVIGVKADHEDNILKGLFENHIYGGDGVDLLKLGTPTNCIDDIASGYNSDEEELIKDFFPTEKNFADSYYHSLMHIFGIKEWLYDWKNYLPIKNIEGNYFKEYEEGLLLGAYEVIKKTFLNFPISYKYFNKIALRGYFPPFRVGEQPYTILPTTDHKKFKYPFPKYSDEESSDFDAYHKFIRSIAELWKKIADKEVLTSAKLSALNETGEHNKAAEKSIEMMMQTPISVSWHERSMLEIKPLLLPDLSYNELLNKYKVPNYISNSGESNILDLLKEVFLILKKRPYWASVGFEQKELKGLDEIEKFGIHPIEDLVKEVGIGEIEDALSQEEIAQYHNINLMGYNETLAGILDVLTYRIDSWLTAFLNLYYESVLAYKTTNNRYIGAWGWVFDLKKKDSQSGSIQDECILAPSINQAITAAIMRSSYNNTKDPRLCINLNSIRVRQALRLIDGIRNGLSVGAVLGADLERGLHEAYKVNSVDELDRYILPLRKKFPLVFTIEETGNNKEKIEARNNYELTVINAELLLNEFYDSWQTSNETISEYLTKGNGKNLIKSWVGNIFKDQHIEAIAKQIEAIADSYDAFSDVIISEGIYQLVNGNRVAFDAVLGSLATGGMPPYPKVTEIPMASAYFSTKTVVAMPRTNTPYSSGYIMDSVQPALGHWVASLTGNLEDVCISVKTKGDNNTFVIDTVSLKDLGVSPLELLYLSSNLDGFANFLKIAYYLKNEIIPVSIDLKAKEGAVTLEEWRSVYQNNLLITELRSMILSSTTMTADDFRAIPSESDGDTSGIDVADLKTNTENLIKKAEALANEMNNRFIPIQSEEKDILELPTNKEIHSMLINLKNCYLLGMTNALSDWSGKEIENDSQMIKNFLNNYASVYKLLTENISLAKNLTKEITSAMQPFDKYKKYEEIQQTLLIKSFKVVPQFLFDSLSTEDLSGQSSQISSLVYKNTSASDLETWVEETSKVREQMQKLQSVRNFEEAYDRPLTDLTVIQMPYDPDNDKDWFGRELKNGETTGDKDSMLIVNKENLELRTKTKNSGLIIDKWVELIPYKQQQGGVVFHCDQPDAEAPNTLLYAINPDPVDTKKWSLDQLINIIKETHFMMQVRAIEPDHIYNDPALSKILPLTIFGKKEIKN
jgi:hypothetical protein